MAAALDPAPDAGDGGLGVGQAQIGQRDPVSGGAAGTQRVSKKLLSHKLHCVYANRTHVLLSPIEVETSLTLIAPSIDHRSSPERQVSVLEGDCLDLLAALPSDSVHLILSDIPYGIGAEDWDVLHANQNSAFLGSSPAQEKAGAIFKRRGKPLNGWSEADRRMPHEYYEWCAKWAPEWLRVLKPGGSAIVMSGRRFSHRCTAALEDAGFTFKDMIGWTRDRAAHRAQRLSVVYERRGDTAAADAWQGWKLGNLRPVFEPILWFTKPYRIGGTIADNALEHGVGAYNEEALLKIAGTADNILHVGFAPGEEATGHPSQKPLALMQALIELTSQPGHLILDPFAGSGTTGLAAQRLGRRAILMERDPAYAAMARKRLDSDAPLFR